MQEMKVWYLGWEDHLQEEMISHSSILAWKIPETEELGKLHSTGSKELGLDSMHPHQKKDKLDSVLYFK